MCPDDRLLQMIAKFKQDHFLDETMVNFKDCFMTNVEKQSKEEQIAQSMITLPIYKEKLSAFCGLWEDYPSHGYHMEFRIEMDQLIGSSNVHDGVAYAKYDGKLIDMIIIHPRQANRPFDHYRGRLGWNGTYIVWEKEDSLCERGWRSTRRWIKIQ